SLGADLVAISTAPPDRGGKAKAAAGADRQLGARTRVGARPKFAVAPVASPASDLLNRSMPDPDPNEVYEVVPTKVEPQGPPAGWRTVTRNGIADRHFSASRKAEAESYGTAPAPRAA